MFLVIWLDFRTPLKIEISKESVQRTQRYLFSLSVRLRNVVREYIFKEQ